MRKAALALALAFFIWPAYLPSPAFSGAKGEGGVDVTETQTLVEEDVSEVVRALRESSGLIYDILQQSYLNNPTLRAARAELRATHEQLPQAMAGFKPNISADADITYLDIDNDGGTFFVSQEGDNTSKTMGVNLQQPLFRGGSTIADTRQAINTIRAQESSLNVTQQEIMLNVATAYMDVLRDRALLRLSKNNRDVIDQQLEATRERFEVGELTRTDVSQAKARHARAESNIITALADLRSSDAIYEQIVGSPPDDNLLYPEIRFSLPQELEEAIRQAEENNPEVIRTKFLNAAAEHDVDSVFGELMPQVSMTGGINKTYDAQGGTLDEQQQMSLGVNASIPLYQSGSIRSRVRQAKHTANRLYLQIIESRRKARQQAISNWETLKAAEAEIRSREAEVEASKIAQEGVQYETQFGERTILDALDADQEYLDAQVSLVTARRNEVVARFALAATLGLLTPETLGFEEKRWDPRQNLENVTSTVFSMDADIDEDRP